MPAPVLARPSSPAKGKLIEVTYRFGGGIGQTNHNPDDGIVAVLTNGDDSYGSLMPGPKEVVDLTGIAAGYRVVDHVKHNDVDMLATTNGTNSNIYRLETTWVLKDSVANAVATCIVTMHDGVDSIVAVGYGSGDPFRFSTNDGANWNPSTLAGTKKNMTKAYVQQDGPTVRVAYVVDPDEVYFGDSLDNNATVATAENCGSAATADDFFTSVTPDPQGNLMFGKRHLLYRRRELSDGSIYYEPVSPWFDDPRADAGGQSDRNNFEQFVNMGDRLFYVVNGYELGMWYQEEWAPQTYEPRKAGDIPRLDLPINALARVGGELYIAIGMKNSASLKTVTNRPGGSVLLQNSFATTSELYKGRFVQTDQGDGMLWRGSILTCTDPLRFMWYDENTSYLYLASGDSEAGDAQQRRCLVYLDNPLLHTVSGAVTLNPGTVTAEFGRYRSPRALLRHVSLRATGLTSAVTAAWKYRNEPGRNTTAAYKTHATYTSVEGAARGTVFPTSRTFEELWGQVVLTGDSNNNLYATVEDATLQIEVL